MSQVLKTRSLVEDKESNKAGTCSCSKCILVWIWMGNLGFFLVLVTLWICWLMVYAWYCAKCDFTSYGWCMWIKIDWPLVYQAMYRSWGLLSSFPQDARCTSIYDLDVISSSHPLSPLRGPSTWSHSFVIHDTPC